MVGKQILNYEISKLLGKGGMGNVYLAHHIKLDRKVAIKSLKQSLIDVSEIKIRFKNEAATLANLKHPNIVTLFDYTEEEDGAYLIMEYVDGTPMDEYISKVSGPIPEEKTIKMMMHMLNAFQYAHDNGIVHRDIKPANVILTSDTLEPKVLDFGIAKVLDDSNKSLTKTGSKIGTVLYMSPEQVRGRGIDHRSDIYSLGVTLFQMLTAAPPYDGEELSEFDINLMIVNDPLPRAKDYYPMVSDEIQEIIDKATQKDVNKRYQSCDEFKQALYELTDEYKNLAASQQTPIYITEPQKEVLPEGAEKKIKIGLSALSGLEILLLIFIFISLKSMSFIFLSVIPIAVPLIIYQVFKSFDGTKSQIPLITSIIALAGLLISGISIGSNLGLAIKSFGQNEQQQEEVVDNENEENTEDQDKQNDENKEETDEENEKPENWDPAFDNIKIQAPKNLVSSRFLVKIKNQDKYTEFKSISIEFTYFDANGEEIKKKVETYKQANIAQESFAQFYVNAPKNAKTCTFELKNAEILE